jgi:pentatricopeptide repeat protein
MIVDEVEKLKIEKLSFATGGVRNLDGHNFRPLIGEFLGFSKEDYIKICSEVYSCLLHSFSKEKNPDKLLSFIRETSASKYHYWRTMTSAIRFISLSGYYSGKIEIETIEDSRFPTGSIFVRIHV